MLLVHFVDNTMQIATSEQEVAITLDILVTHLHIRGRETNLTKLQKPLASVRFLGGQWYNTCRDLRWKRNI